MFSRIWLKVISKKAKAQEIRLLSLKCLLWLPLEICTDLKWCHVATIRSQISGLIQQVLAWDSHIVEHHKPVVRERRKCYRKELLHIKERAIQWILMFLCFWCAGRSGRYLLLLSSSSSSSFFFLIFSLMAPTHLKEQKLGWRQQKTVK